MPRACADLKVPNDELSDAAPRTIVAPSAFAVGILREHKTVSQLPNDPWSTATFNEL